MTANLKLPRRVRVVSLARLLRAPAGFPMPSLRNTSDVSTLMLSPEEPIEEVSP